MGAEVLAIGAGDSRAVAAYRERLGLPYPVLADPDGRTYERYAVGRWLLGLLRQTALVVVDLHGRIRYSRIVNNPQSALRMDELRAAVEAARSEV